MSMDDTCDHCKKELSSNIRLNTEVTVGNGSQFTDHYDLCCDCAKGVVDYIKHVKKG